MIISTFYGLCTNCQKLTNMAVKEEEEVIIVRQEPVKVKVQYTKCSECGDEVIDPTVGDDPFDLAYREYRKRHGPASEEG